ncbi:MAG: SAM-dependent methyltransferase [Spirochaeta sp.]
MTPAGKTPGESRKPLRELLRSRFPHLSKDQLFALLATGDVRVNGEVQRSGAERVPVSAQITVHGDPAASGGRGRYKLQAALDEWSLPVEGLVWLDAGASTGGFTACLLEHGAGLVHAVDVGYNQLDYRLRIDPRVQVWERCNIMQPRSYDPRPDAFCMDLSFRSSLKPIQTILPLCRLGWGVVLLKPQFEWVDPPDWFDGIVPEEYLSAVVSETIGAWEASGITVEGILPSPVRGRQGNQEYLVHVSAKGVAAQGLPDVHPVSS